MSPGGAVREDDALIRFGFPPDPSHAEAIRRALVEDTARERTQQGSGDTLLMRVLCAQLFCLGHQEDTLLIWSAKQASMDAAISIDVQLLCATGLEATRTFLMTQSSASAARALKRLDDGVEAGDFEDFDPSRFRAALRAYYCVE